MAVYLEYQRVYQPRTATARNVKMHIFAAVLLLVALVVKVWVKVESTSVGYALARARQESVELDMERRELLLGVSVLRRADNIQRVSSQTLGLTPLHPNQIRRVRD